MGKQLDFLETRAVEQDKAFLECDALDDRKKEMEKVSTDNGSCTMEWNPNSGGLRVAGSEGDVWLYDATIEELGGIAKMFEQASSLINEDFNEVDVVYSSVGCGHNKWSIGVRSVRSKDVIEIDYNHHPIDGTIELQNITKEDLHNFADMFNRIANG